MLAEIRTGPIVSVPSGVNPARGENTGALVVQDAHLRLHEANVRGNMYTFGISNTALATTNAIATGVTASATPVIGVWNPATSLVNLVILKAVVSTTTIANTAVSPGGWMWVASTNQSAISTGSSPYNCKTLAQSGSSAKAFAMSTALTGLSGSLNVIRAASIGTINAAGPSTAITQPIGPIEELVDGAFIVPPGGVLAIMNQVSTTTVSCSVGIIWEEVPIVI